MNRPYFGRLRVGAVAAAAATLLAGCPLQDEETALDSSVFEVAAPAMPRPISPLAPPAMTEPEKVSLGRSLFRDRRLSRDESIACVSCHDLTEGGDDGRRVSTGFAGRQGQVNAPTVLNSGLNFAQFWDGRARTLEGQIDSTVRNSVEMAGDWADIERVLADDPETAAAFGRVYGDGVTTANVIDALAAYVRALITVNAPFDRYLRGDSQAVGDSAREGYELFVSLGCVSCHQGRNIGGNLFQRFGVMGNYFADRGDVTDSDYGRYNVTGRESDRYKFKVPSLRNVADTAPYFHDGSADTLEDAVEIMVQYQLGRPASSEQVTRLTAFLRSLSGTLDESLL